MDFDTGDRVETELCREIIDLVPHWYEAPCGPQRFSITIGDQALEFCNHFELTPRLRTFLETIGRLIGNLPLESFAQYPGLSDVLLESIAIEWLRVGSAAIHWVPLVKYLSMLARRTNENLPVSLNLVIKPGVGQDDVTRPAMQKFVDHLASSPGVYLAIDAQLRIMDYAEVRPGPVEIIYSSAFVPSFLQPIHTEMGPEDFSAHVTRNGDVILMDIQGVLAARRKGKWKVFDVPAFRRSLFLCIGNEFVATNLLDILLELSFTRQGALFIYDPLHCMRGHILNQESIVSDRWLSEPDPGAVPSGQSVFSLFLKDIAFGMPAGTIGSKRRLLEIATVDGAVVFDHLGLLAVGAIVESHPEVGNQLGARSTAARSSFLWGSHPTAVSSDGEISVYFKSKGGDDVCDAIMLF